MSATLPRTLLAGRLPSLLLAAGIAALLAAGGSLAGRGAAPTKPSAASADFQTTDVDFGEVAAGEVLTAEFPVRNRGGRRLVLQPPLGNGDCDCGGEPPQIVPPGESAALQATLDTRGLAGAVEQPLRVETNDPRHPAVILTLRASVVPPPAE